MPKQGQTCRCGRHVWDGERWELAPNPVDPVEKRTKHCQKCHRFIPDDHALCDFHLLEKHGLAWEGVCLEGRDTLYPKDVVLAALRAAERRRD